MAANVRLPAPTGQGTISDVPIFRRENVYGPGLFRGYHALAADGIRAYVVRSSGLRHDSKLLRPLYPAALPTRRLHLSVPISGELWLRRGEQSLVIDSNHAWLEEPSFEYERWMGAPHVSLHLEWSLDLVGATAEQGRILLGAETQFRCARLATAILDPGVRHQERHRRILAVVESLADAGLPLDPNPFAHALAPLGPNMTRTCDALGEVLSALSDQPMESDLEARLQVSNRQLRRRLPGLLRMFGGANETFRDMVHRVRLCDAVGLIAGTSLSVVEVAKLVGYGSPHALRRALRRRQLAAPSVLRRTT